MKPTPAGWPRISTALYFENAAKAIDWLCKAFGFEVRLKIEGDGGRIAHSELVYGEGLIMVGEAKKESRNDAAKSPAGESTYRRSPRELGGANTQSMMVYVDDVEAHCKRAREAGAKIVAEPKTTDYGEGYWTDRGYEAEDLEGHHWFFYQRLRDPVKK
jgi:uncharacterized glyoxalase superfamily protein PhnB